MEVITQHPMNSCALSDLQHTGNLITAVGVEIGSE